MEKLKKAIREPEKIVPYLTERWFEKKKSLVYRHLLVRHGEAIIKRKVNGFDMYLDLSDRGISRDLAGAGIREPFTTRAYERALAELKTEVSGPVQVFEIGANIGYYALTATKVLGVDGMIHGVEADPENVEMCKRNIKLNGWDERITVENVGLSSESGSQTLYQSGHSNLHTMAKEGIKTKGSQRQVSEIEVDVLTGEEYLSKIGFSEGDINAVRMDVEGFEAEVFRGIEAVVGSDSPFVLQVEFHPKILSQDDTEYLIDLLSSNGFEIRSAANGARPYEITQLEELSNFSTLELVATRNL